MRRATVSVPIPSRRLTLVAGQVITAIIGLALVIPSLPLNHHAPFGTRTVSPDPLSVEAKTALLRKLDAAADSLPATKMLATPDEWYAWTIEILPYMTYEGVIHGAARPPHDVAPFYFLNSRMFHLGGMAFCRDRDGKPALGPIGYNFRYINHVSPRYADERALSVLVHEIVHMQGGPFCTGPSESVEADTQIATVEVMAAMVNHGNRAVLRPLLLDLRSMVLASIQAEVSKDEYLALVAEIANDPFEVSRAEKSLRFWYGAPGGAEELAAILRRYNVTPVNALIEAAYDGTVERIQLPDIGGYECPPCGGVLHRPFIADDLLVFWAHLDEYVEAAR